MATAEVQQSQDMSSQSEPSHRKDAFIDFMGGVAGKFKSMFLFFTRVLYLTPIHTAWQVNLWMGIYMYKEAPGVPFLKAFQIESCIARVKTC